MSNSDDEDKAGPGNDLVPAAPYKVGYKKPPLHTQFKPGQSGNPSGLAKIPATSHEMLWKKLYKKVPVMENGKLVKKTQLDLFLNAMIKNALTKGPRSQALLLNFLELSDAAARGDEPARLRALRRLIGRR